MTTICSHAALGASTAHRWMSCPGSVRLSAAAAHMLAKICLDKGVDAPGLIGRKVNGYAAALLGRHRVSDEAFAALQTRFGLEGVVDLTATIGYYAMIACALNAFAVEPSPGEPPLPD